MSKISALTALTGANLADADLLPVVDTSATSTVKMTTVEMKQGLGMVSGTFPMSDNIIMPKATNKGFKIDPASPDFGWNDMLGSLHIRAAGANDPTFAAYGGFTAMRAFSFSATVMNEIFIEYHVPHDYVPGTAIYFHTHWSNGAAVPNTGDVIWGTEYSWAKGYNQAAFSAAATVTVTQTCPATRYQHMIAETTAVTIAGLEVDSLILVRVYRDAAAGGDTCSDAVFLHMADVHYQSTGINTKQRNGPNFYT